jgi:hypothetical protein
MQPPPYPSAFVCVLLGYSFIELEEKKLFLLLDFPLIHSSNKKKSAAKKVTQKYGH